jgi:hypothetical protein
MEVLNGTPKFPKNGHSSLLILENQNRKHTNTLRPSMYNQANIPSKKYKNIYCKIFRQEIQINLSLYHPHIEDTREDIKPKLGR